jgi:hydroxymethylpyrimidine/phosphomethylpyrimidine kinase
VKALQGLVMHADVITPNTTEAALLLGGRTKSSSMLLQRYRGRRNSGLQQCKGRHTSVPLGDGT